jgi:dTDP-4-amino-4,6-dideoxygalactose transaminase
MKIPFMDLNRQYQTIKPEVLEAFNRIMDTSNFIGGADKENFEKEFAKLVGVKHCIGVGNGTDSLMLILKALGIKENEQIIVPANSFIASSEAVTACGATPIFCDVDEETALINLDQVEELLKNPKNRIRGVIPVHLYGRIVNMKRLMALAKQFNVYVIEDCAQSHLAKVDGVQAGAWGHAGSFSFYPGKNLGAFGDAGAVVTNDEALAEKVRKLANHGRIGKYDHDMEGYNSRLDGLQAAFLRVKLPRLAEWTQKRQRLAARYYDQLKDVKGIKILSKPSQTEEHVYHLFVIETNQREFIQKYLKEKKGVETGVHYPTALPFLKAYQYLEHSPEDFPVSFKMQGKILSLPLFPELTIEEQDYIVDSLREAVQASLS